MTLETYIEARLAESVPAERVGALEELAQTVARTVAPKLMFICTHNSRRSHLSQVWAQAGAWRFGLDDVETFSGGTEATAFNPRAVAALERAGFRIERRERGSNPVYVVRSTGDGPATECFSKVFTDLPNPVDDFVAVMTCSSADAACPVVPGASARFTISYVDPKESDGTQHESATYDERCAQIACEMLWVMKRAAELRSGR